MRADEPGARGSRKQAVPVWDDTRLVKECLRGNEQAWSLLIDKYQSADLFDSRKIPFASA